MSSAMEESEEKQLKPERGFVLRDRPALEPMPACDKSNQALYSGAKERPRSIALDQLLPQLQSTISKFKEEDEAAHATAGHGVGPRDPKARKKRRWLMLTQGLHRGGLPYMKSSITARLTLAQVYLPFSFLCKSSLFLLNVLASGMLMVFLTLLMNAWLLIPYPFLLIGYLCCGIFFIYSAALLYWHPCRKIGSRWRPRPLKFSSVYAESSNVLVVSHMSPVQVALSSLVLMLNAGGLALLFLFYHRWAETDATALGLSFEHFLPLAWIAGQLFYILGSFVILYFGLKAAQKALCSRHAPPSDRSAPSAESGLVAIRESPCESSESRPSSRLAVSVATLRLVLLSLFALLFLIGFVTLFAAPFLYSFPYLQSDSLPPAFPKILYLHPGPRRASLDLYSTILEDDDYAGLHLQLMHDSFDDLGHVLSLFVHYSTRQVLLQWVAQASDPDMESQRWHEALSAITASGVSESQLMLLDFPQAAQTRFPKAAFGLTEALYDRSNNVTDLAWLSVPLAAHSRFDALRDAAPKLHASPINTNYLNYFAQLHGVSYISTFLSSAPHSSSILLGWSSNYYQAGWRLLDAASLASLVLSIAAVAVIDLRTKTKSQENCDREATLRFSEKSQL